MAEQRKVAPGPAERAGLRLNCPMCLRPAVANLQYEPCSNCGWSARKKIGEKAR